jgi:hypothetical protein
MAVTMTVEKGLPLPPLSEAEVTVPDVLDWLTLSILALLTKVC